MKILIAEDDPHSRDLLVRFLEARGNEITAAANGVEALERFHDGIDLVLLDVMMPKMDGWAALEEIRSRSDTPVIMVTVKDSTEDKVKGLSLGADDYIAKPFDLREVQARIEAVMRRSVPGAAPLEIGDLVIDDEKKEVQIHGKVVDLSPKEYDLLKLFASRPGKVFSHHEIITKIWPEGSLASSEDVKKYIYLLRNKIEDNPEEPKLIVTARGFGYKLAV